LQLGYLAQIQIPFNEFRAKMTDGCQLSRRRACLAILIFSHFVICCVSLVYCANYHVLGSPFDPTAFHIFYDPARLGEAIFVVASFGAIGSLAFLFARFSFGYFVGFYLYAMVFGYLWLNCFSDLNYDHHVGGASAAASAIVFLWPALYVRSPVRQAYQLSSLAFERLLRLILLVAVATIVIGASYNFRLVTLENIYDYRDKLEAPTIVNYLVAMTSSSLLPFAFACFVMRNDRLRAGAVLALLLLFYPITLSKLAFFTPLWLCFIVLLSRFFEDRVAAVLSLFLPILAGVIFFALFPAAAETFFGTINFRRMAIPSVAMDVYNDFFSKHELTHFCQISVLKLLVHCPYQEPLAIVFKKAYGLGNFNASLFATEGIASVGPWFAPLAAFICGLIIALGNRLSSGLPPRFILVSSAILPQVLLDVPLSIAMLTHGAAMLFLLWYVTPRAMFDRKVSDPTPAAHESIAVAPGT
jgi:hypothetical protein